MQLSVFHSARHEPLMSHEWNSSSVREGISEILTETENAFDAKVFWPEHPDDADWSPKRPMTSLFWGAASTVWSLCYFQEYGLLNTSKKWSQVIDDIYHSYLMYPDSGTIAPGYLFGKSGIALVGLKYGADSQLWAKRLYDAMAECIDRQENEVMWALPGALIAAQHAFLLTKDERWAHFIQQNAQNLIDLWHDNNPAKTWLWEQDLYGHKRHFLGAVHGFIGNVFSLLFSFEHLSENQREAVTHRIVTAARETAVRDGDLLNWPSHLELSAKPLMQFCHGAPGFLVCLSRLRKSADAQLEGDLIKAGETIWTAGPLKKPFGLCHGTAGNAYAFLTLYRRTGQAHWLNRARAFAMHALAQSNQQLKIHGRRRYSVLTGDMGLALALWHCELGETKFPFYDLI